MKQATLKPNLEGTTVHLCGAYGTQKRYTVPTDNPNFQRLIAIECEITGKFLFIHNDYLE